MSNCTKHGEHRHVHGNGCGHVRVRHEGHVDFLHDGHLHHVHKDHVDEHRIEVTSLNPTLCTDGHACSDHTADHEHGPDCGHQTVPHGEHVDYLVNGHLHHQHEGHCDHHGAVLVIH